MTDSRILDIPNRVSVEGDQVVVDGEPVRELAEANVEEVVADAVYAYIYAQLPPNGAAAEEDPDLADALIDAIDTQERWDAGWKLDSIGPNGEVSVTKDGSWRHVLPGDYRRDPAGRGFQPNTRIAILVRPIDFESQPGSVYLRGDHFDDRASNAWLGRLYFNASPDVAVPIVRDLSKRLNEFSVPFTMKCPANAQMFARVDSLVMYIPMRYFDIASMIVAEHDALLARLEPEHPIFTKALAPGLGFAEDPGPPWSFGSHRSRLVARALLRLRDDGGAWMDALGAEFEAAGLDVAVPYLDSTTVDALQLTGARNA